MAVKFGMTVLEIIGQLTRGFMKAMGRKPDGLEKIKIQQEAVQRFKDMNKVVDMEGNVIDTSKGIMGGKQVGQKGIFDNIFARMQKDMGKNIKEVKTKNRPDVYDLDDYDITNMSDIKKEIKKTKEFNKFLEKNNLANALIISDEDSLKNISKSARNIKNIKLIKQEGTNIYDMFKYKNVIMTSSSVKKIEDRILNEKN